MMMGRCSPVMGCGFSLEGARTWILYQHRLTFLTALGNFKKANSDRKRTGPARYSWTSVPQIPHHPGDNRTSPSLSGAEKEVMSSILRSPFPWYLSAFTVLKVVSRGPILADAVRRDAPYWKPGPHRPQLGVELCWEVERCRGAREAGCAALRPVNVRGAEIPQTPDSHPKALDHHKFTHCMEQFHNPVTFQQ
jgi:hypothetical protein